MNDDLYTCIKIHTRFDNLHITYVKSLKFLKLFPSQVDILTFISCIFVSLICQDLQLPSNL